MEKERAIVLKKNLIEESRVIKGIRLITSDKETTIRYRQRGGLCVLQGTDLVFFHFCLPSSDGKANLTLMYTDDLFKTEPTLQLT